MTNRGRSDRDLTDWAAVRALFDAALALGDDAPAVQALLAEPSHAAAVVAEVRSLLEHHAAADGGLTAGPRVGFTATSAAGPGSVHAVHAADEAGETLAGHRVGAWRIVSRLGTGGMGEVWLAERADGTFTGEAAIKLLKPGMDSGAVLARFEHERRALARLAHPHIARLLDAGATAAGAPYFVMERVSGVPIDQAARGLPVARRIALFLQLADAVAHAHRRLLVHRDLKPSNVLVDAEGQVKLLDFGIAKALDPLEGGGAGSDLTIAGERPLTPHYASPEQVRGEPVTTATDIYSLGVLLYLLLTGLRPTGRRASTAAEVVRSVLEEVPTRPSRLSEGEVPDADWPATRRQLEGDLDNILMKALAKSGEERYASVDAFAADLVACLEGRPVSARTATPGYLLAKFVRRNRFAVLTAAAGTLGLATALAATVLQGRIAAALGVLALGVAMVIALVMARSAALARDAATQASDEARRQLERVKRITHELLFRYGDTVTTLPGGAKAQEAMLTDAVRLLEPALAGAPDDLDLVATMASALARLAEILGNNSLAAPERAGDAEAAVERAIALGERAWPQARGDWRFASWFARALIVKGQLARARGRLDEAAQALLQAVQRAEAAAQGRPADEGWMYLTANIANAHIYLAQLNDHQNAPNRGRPQQALEHFDRAEAVLRSQLAQSALLQALDRAAPPGDAATAVYLQHQLATVISGRAIVQLNRDDLGAARRENEAALALRHDNVAREPRNVSWRDGLMTEANTQALILLRLGENALALESSALALHTAQGLARDEGPHSRWAGAAVQAVVGAMHGRALAANGRAAEGEPLIGAAVEFWAARSAAAPGDESARLRLAAHHVQRGQARLALGRPGDARADAHAALQATRALNGSRRALLVAAEAHALLVRLASAPAGGGDDDSDDSDAASTAATHRSAALDALLAAQQMAPLGADHARLQASLAA